MRSLNDQLWIAELKRTFSFNMLSGNIHGIGYRKGTKPDDDTWYAYIETFKHGCYYSDGLTQDAAYALACCFSQKVSAFLEVANPIVVAGPKLTRMVLVPHTSYVMTPEETKRVLSVSAVFDAGRYLIILTFNRDSYGRVQERILITDGCNVSQAVLDIAEEIDRVQQACGLPKR